MLFFKKILLTVILCCSSFFVHLDGVLAATPAKKWESAERGASAGSVCDEFVALATNEEQNEPDEAPRSADSHFLAGVAGVLEAEQLHSLFHLYWNWRMIDSPEEASFLGEPGLPDQWSDLSEEAFSQRQQFISQCLDTLNSIPIINLNENDRMNAQIFKRILEESLANILFGNHFLILNQMDGVHLYVPLIIEMMPHQNIADYQNIISRLSLIPTLIEQTIALIEKGIQLGITPPKIALSSLPQQIFNQIIENPSESSLLKAFHEFPSTIDNSTQLHLLNEAISIYQHSVKPSFIKLYHYVNETYLPHCRQTIGFNHLKNGNDWYAHLVRSLTTTSLTPEEIHNIGVKEVERIEQEMKTIIHSTHFEGTFDDFLQFMKSNSQFFYSNREELLDGYRSLTRDIESKLPLLFDQMPTLPFEVIPIPSYSEESQIAAYYCPGSISHQRPGYFFINTSYPEQRPKWEMEPLALHEAVPGHHMQMSLAQELQHVPNFRKHANFTAYIEGWGLYSESLGTELGFYRDPYSLFGRLSYEMLRAIRLVVDTGMHSKGWSREQAIDFFKRHVGMSDHEITTEVNRYLVMPGQALAYKIGELKIQKMRRLATEQLGQAFDIRAFHHIWLQNGTVPLDIAEEQVEQWIQKSLNS